MQRISDYTAQLGEGALWNNRSGELYWVDIEAKRLLIYDPGTDTNRIFQFEMEIGTVVPAAGGRVLVALEDGIYRFDPATGNRQLLAANPQVAETRFNDGKCDPAGRFWVGTIDRQHTRPLATLFRMGSDYTLQTMKRSVVISNGITWSRDKTRMYYIDTRTQKVVQYNYDNQTGNISQPEDIIIVPPEMGRPDGCTLDAEGMLWIAMWAGGTVTRWRPGTGELLQKMEVPALNVSSVAFGGPDLSTLYITTARTGMTAADNSRYPLAGGLFACKPGVQGIPACFFDGG